MSRLADRLAHALLRAAAARQPVALRADLHREWLAELHVLAAEGRLKPMLGYALSLAVSRPAHAEAVPGGTGALRRAVANTVLVLVAPALCYGLLMVSLTAMGVLWDVLSPAVFTHQEIEHLRMPVVTLFVLCFAVLVGWASWWLGAHGPLRGTWPVAILVLLLVVGTEALTSQVIDFNLGSGMAVWLPALLAAVLVAGRQARLGRPRRGWLLGAATMALLIQAAMLAMTFWQRPDGMRWHYEYAMLWLPAVFTGWSFTLPYPTPDQLYPTPEELSRLLDSLPAMPQLVLLLAAYAIGYAVGAARPAQEEPSPAVSAASSSSSSSSIGSGTISA